MTSYILILKLSVACIQIKVLGTTTAGSYANPQTVGMFDGVRRIKLGDIDGDGKTDIIAASMDNNVSEIS